MADTKRETWVYSAELGRVMRDDLEQKMPVVAFMHVEGIDIDGAHKRGRLIAASPDLLAAVKAQNVALDILLSMLIERDPSFFPSQSAAWPAVIQGQQALAKASAS